MRYYPVFLRLEGARCVVVGGGRVAERKVATLLAAGARVSVIAPALTAALAARVADGAVVHAARPYRAGDLAGARLAFAATDDPTAQAAVAAEADAAGVPLNVADAPGRGSFIVPSVLCRGDLSVAVSTGGGSPALAKRVRQDIGRALGPEYERAVDLLARLRRRLRAGRLAGAERRRILSGLLASDLLERLREPDAAAVDRLLAEHAGAGISLRSLGTRW